MLRWSLVLVWCVLLSTRWGRIGFVSRDHCCLPSLRGSRVHTRSAMLSGPDWTSAAELHRVHMNPMPPVMNDAFDLAPGCIPSSLYQAGLHSCASSTPSQARARFQECLGHTSTWPAGTVPNAFGQAQTVADHPALQRVAVGKALGDRQAVNLLRDAPSLLVSAP